MQGDPVILRGEVRKRAVDDRQRLGHRRMATLAGRRDGYAARTPHKERRSELELDLLDPLRHRSPREVQNLGRAIHAAVDLGLVTLPTQINRQALFERARSPEGVSFWDLPGLIASAREAGLATARYELRWHGERRGMYRLSVRLRGALEKTAPAAPETEPPPPEPPSACPY